jgi:AcrR family transcriptional regulator
LIRGHFLGEVNMDSTLSRRERKKLETRQGLLEAAVDLFHEKGYAATTVEEITERADVAKGTFFNYFPSKEALLGEVAIWGVEKLRATLDVSKGAPASPVSRLKLLTRLLYEHHAHDMQLARQAFATRLCDPPPPPKEARQRLFGFFTELVSEAQACGEIRADVDPELVSDLLRLSYFRHMIAWSRDAQWQPAEYFDHIIDLLMDGLAGPNWRHA